MGFVRASGTSLTLNGQTYRFTGFNIYNATSVNNCWYTMGTGSALDTALNAAPGQEAFRAWFFPSLRGDWSPFDHTLQVAAAHGVKVIPVLTNHWGDCEGPRKTDDWYRTGYKASWRQYVAEVVTRYRNDPTILMWQLVNEAEACDPPALRAFAADMAGVVKAIDTNHLLSLGTIGSGQCGASGDDYRLLHAVNGIDICEYHDYQPGAMPGDQWNGLQVRLNQCGELNKPLFVGEAGIVNTDPDRVTKFDAKHQAQFAAGVDGILIWEWRNAGQSGGDQFTVTPPDALIGRY